MSVAYVANISAADVTSTSNSTTITLTTNRTVAAGHTILLGAAHRGTLASAGVSSVSDNSGNGYTWHVELVETTGSPSSANLIRCFCTSGLASGTVITVTFAGTTARKWLMGIEVSGLADATFDKSAVNKAGTGNPDTGATGTTTQADEFAFAVFEYGTSTTTVTGTAGSGWTEVGDSWVDGGSSPHFEGYSEYKILTSTGTVDATYSVSDGGGGTWAAVVGAFKGKAVTAVTDTALNSFSDAPARQVLRKNISDTVINPTAVVPFNYANHTSGATLVTSETINEFSLTGNGNTLVLAVSPNTRTATVSGITDSAGNAGWVRLDGNESTSAAALEIWMCPKAAPVTSITVNWSASTKSQMAFVEVVGLLGIGDDSTSINNTVTSTSASMSLTTLAPHDFIITAISSLSTTTAINAGWTKFTGGDGQGYFVWMAYQEVQSTGTYTATWTLSPTNVSTQVTAALRATGIYDSVVATKSHGSIAVLDTALSFNDSSLQKGFSRAVLDTALSFNSNPVRNAVRVLSEPALSLNDSVVRNKNFYNNVVDAALSADYPGETLPNQLVFPGALSLMDIVQSLSTRAIVEPALSFSESFVRYIRHPITDIAFSPGDGVTASKSSGNNHFTYSPSDTALNSFSDAVGRQISRIKIDTAISLLDTVSKRFNRSVVDAAIGTGPFYPYLGDFPTPSLYPGVSGAFGDIVISQALRIKTDIGTGVDIALRNAAGIRTDPGHGTDVSTEHAWLGFYMLLEPSDSLLPSDTLLVGDGIGTIGLDTATGSDSSSLKRVLTGTDTAHGTDVSTPKARYSNSDTGTGFDGGGVKKFVTSDSGSGHELSAELAKFTTEDGTLLPEIYLAPSLGLYPGGVGTDSSTLHVSFINILSGAAKDNGTGIETRTLKVVINVTDSAHLVESPFVQNPTGVRIIRSENGQSTETSFISQSLFSVIQTGTGVDVSIPHPAYTRADSAHGTESSRVDLAGIKSAHDVGQIVDTSTLAINFFVRDRMTTLDALLAPVRVLSPTETYYYADDTDIEEVITGALITAVEDYEVS